METITSRFSQGHARLDRLFQEYRQLKRTDFRRAKERFLEFARGLERHILWEEKLLFPMFDATADVPDVGPTAMMRQEHRRIERLLEGIRGRLAGGEVTGDELEGSLLEWLDAHNEKEEKVLYPWMDRTLPAAARARVLESSAEASSAATPSS